MKPSLYAVEMARMVACWTVAAASFFAFSGRCAAQPGEQTADLAVVNARVYTVDPQNPSATAIAVQGNRILAVGDDVSQFIGPRTRKIDAGGKTIVPGLIDSHGHLLELGRSLASLNLRGVTSEQEIGERVKTAARAAHPGEWIFGNAWDQNLWRPKQFPSKATLDRAAPQNPVVLTRVDGHALWANSRVLALANLDRNTPDPAGGRLLRDGDGELTGVAVDNAQSLILSKEPAPDQAQIESALEQAGQRCVRLGLTTIHDAGINATTLAAYRELAAQHRLPLRVYAMLAVKGEPELWKTFRARGPEIGEFFTLRCLKIFADGALGSRGAALLEPYADDPDNRGLLLSPPGFIEKTAREALAAGFQVATHAIGDRANRIVLQAYAAALGNLVNDKRFRVEHAQVIAPEDFARFRDNSVIASMQPTHATSDMPWAALRLGPQRIQGAYAWQTFRKMGVRLAFGSDFPVEDPNPIWGFYSAVTRQDHNGNPPGGWFPDQRLTRAEALRGWTMGGAYAAFQETQKGSITPGKLADFVMLSDNIMEAAPAVVWRTRVVLTVLDGKIAYQE